MALENVGSFIRRGVSIAVIDTMGTEDGICDCSSFSYAHDLIVMLADHYGVSFQEIKVRGEP